MAIAMVKIQLAIQLATELLNFIENLMKVIGIMEKFMNVNVRDNGQVTACTSETENADG